MQKGSLVFVRNGEIKATLPVNMIEIKSDGTIWCKGLPVIGETEEKAKKQIELFVKNREFDKIPQKAFTKIGTNENGLWVGDSSEWMHHPDRIQADKQRQEIARKTVTIHLSTRGWGDYSSVEWIGDITRPIDDILNECKLELQSSNDVDHALTDDQIIDKITGARVKWSTPKASHQHPVAHGPGYCYSCESYCYGDCGNYTPTINSEIIKRDFELSSREQDYGIND